MKQSFSDEQLDQILRQIVKDSALSSEEVDNIADSTLLWRNVQRSINETMNDRQNGWIPPWFDWRIAVFASAFLVVCFGLFWFSIERANVNFAQIEAVNIPNSELPTSDDTESGKIFQDIEKAQITETHTKQKTLPKKIISTKSSPNPSVSKRPVNRSVNVAQTVKIQPNIKEVKTDFIALNYSPAAESGQIMKVKVPRSMMVSLGVTTKVENSEELVNAEVLVGDDGLARAIRFIQ